MVEKLDDVPRGTLGSKASGKCTREEFYELLIEAGCTKPSTAASRAICFSLQRSAR
jgi:hypothetical protein